MKKNLPLLLFLLTEFSVAVFIMATSVTLPENVASHFGGAGLPNGFMSRQGYTQFMLLFSVGIPSLIVFSMSLAMGAASSSINVPNKAYWLSPENKADTVQFLKGHSTFLGVLITGFIAYVHWLVLKANSFQPPHLSNILLFSGMGVFLASLLVWGLWLVVRFNRVPRP